MRFPPPEPPIDPQRPTPQLLVWAYAQGMFPMADPRHGGLDWYSPDPRAVIPLDDFHVPKSLVRVVRQKRFDVRSDTAFEQVMRQCAMPREQDNLTWINQTLIDAYTGLHDLGHAHSVEAWRRGELVGGLYGVHIGAAFFGESMFSRPARGGTDASKVCLVYLVDHMRARGFELLDTQFRNPHLEQFGCIEIPRDEYLRRLASAIAREVEWQWSDGPQRRFSRRPGA